MSKNAPSLEDERKAILSRMQASRDGYRRMLMTGSEDHTPSQHISGNYVHDRSTATHASHFSGGVSGGGMGSGYNPYQVNAAAQAALNWAKQHPLICAAAVAAIVAIGPKRIAKTVGAGMATGGTALGALTASTLNNPSNIENLTRLISTVMTYLQQHELRDMNRDIQRERGTHYPP